MTSLTTSPPKLLDQLRSAARYRHFALATEKAYAHWVRAYVRFHGLRHPREMGAPEVEAFLTHLAEVRQVSPSTHKQALAALLFLYREVLKMNLPWMAEVGRPRAVRRLPVVLTTDELQRTLAGLEGSPLLLAQSSPGLVSLSVLHGRRIDKHGPARGHRRRACTRKRGRREG